MTLQGTTQSAASADSLAGSRTRRIIFRFYQKFNRIIRCLVAVLFMLILVTQSSLPRNMLDQVRAHTRWIEFDFVTWTLDSLLIKSSQGALNLPQYLDQQQQHDAVIQYLQKVAELKVIDQGIEYIYADPNVTHPKEKAADLLAQRSLLEAHQAKFGPVVESILQQQVSSVLADLGLAPGGQPVPPVIYHVTDLPMALIVSPREKIRPDADISLSAGLTVDEITDVETTVEQAMNVSALIVPVGGVGIYPPMVMSTADITWLLEVISHEWTHNFLTLRPLGASYYAGGEMRTVNETTASIAGKEIGNAVLARYYPEYLPEPVAEQPAAERPVAKQPSDIQLASTDPTTENEPVVFNIRQEMHATRVEVDRLLEAGKVEEAEQFMETQRQYFWSQGYQYRRLNQAYFAFYGMYADVPGGAAGQDPVGPAVRKLREQSESLAEFMNRISWIHTFKELEELVK